MTDNGKPTCEAIAADGMRCRLDFGLNPDGKCFHHSDHTAEARARARSQAGKTTAERRRRQSKTIQVTEAMEPPRTAAEAKKWSAWLAWAAVTGELDKGTVREASGAIRVFLASLKQADYEHAIDELRAEVRGLKSLKLEVL